MVRGAAAGLCITTNGLAIEDGTYDVSGLIDWYNENVRTADGFVITANNFADFERAAIATIGREISNVPEPASLALVGLALVGSGFALGLRVVGRPEGSPAAPACRPLQSGQLVCTCSGC